MIKAPRQEQVAEIKRRNPDKRPVDIARELGLTRQRVGAILKGLGYPPGRVKRLPVRYCGVCGRKLNPQRKSNLCFACKPLTKHIINAVAKWLNKEISLEKLVEELGYNFYDFVERWPIFKKPIVEDIQILHDRIWQEAKQYYFSILGACLEKKKETNEQNKNRVGKESPTGTH